MATSLRNLSSYNPEEIPSASDLKFGIAVAEWNKDVTFSMLHAAVETLKKHGTPEENIIVEFVPGSFELIAAAKFMSQHHRLDAIITLGCVIQGETRHFDFICEGVTYGIAELNLTANVPVIYGVLTTLNQQQALDRAGGKHGNKGTECAVAAIKMARLAKRNR